MHYIPHHEAKLLTPDQIIALFEFDHYPIPHAEGGPDEPWNLDPVFKPVHREKTAKVDIPTIAKGKRLRRKEGEHTAAMAAKEPGKPRQRKGTIKGRPFNSKGKRPFSNRRKP